jgi:hypothetical protein
LLDPELHVGCEKAVAGRDNGSIARKEILRGKIMERYIAIYESWREEQGRGMEESEFKAMESNLDGSY